MPLFVMFIPLLAYAIFSVLASVRKCCYYCIIARLLLPYVWLGSHNLEKIKVLFCKWKNVTSIVTSTTNIGTEVHHIGSSLTLRCDRWDVYMWSIVQTIKNCVRAGSLKSRFKNVILKATLARGMSLLMPLLTSFPRTMNVSHEQLSVRPSV